MSTWDLRFESDCAVLTLRNAGEARFYADAFALTIDGERTDYPLDKVEGVRVALPWLPHLLRPFLENNFTQYTPFTFYRNGWGVSDDYAWRPEAEVAFIGPDRGWQHRETKFDGERLWLGTDVHHAKLRGRFGLRVGPWRKGVAANYWLAKYMGTPALVSDGSKFDAWFADLDALPSRWEMDRSWAKVNGLPFDERPHYYGRIVGWEVAAWVVGGVLAFLALTAFLDPEAMDVALTLGFFGAVFCTLAHKLDTMRRRLSDHLQPDKVTFSEEVRRFLRRLRGSR